MRDAPGSRLLWSPLSASALSAMATHITPAAAQGQTRKYFASTTHQDTFEEAAGI